MKIGLWPYLSLLVLEAVPFVPAVSGNQRKNALKGQRGPSVHTGHTHRDPARRKTVLVCALSVHMVSRTVEAPCFSSSTFFFLLNIFGITVTSKRGVCVCVGRIYLSKFSTSQALTSSLIGPVSSTAAAPRPPSRAIHHTQGPGGPGAVLLARANCVQFRTPEQALGRWFQGDRVICCHILDSAGWPGWSQHSAQGTRDFGPLSFGYQFPVTRTDNVQSILARNLAEAGPSPKKAK